MIVAEIGFIENKIIKIKITNTQNTTFFHNLNNNQRFI